MADKREEFIAKFVASFLAAYAAGRYDNFCSLGKAYELSRYPVEDAIFLAEAAWNQFAGERPAAR